MFPIPWDFPFRKKNGDVTTISDVFGGGGGSSSKNITPVYSGLSYGYESGGKWVGSDTKKYYLLLFPVTANKIYLINKADQVGNRCRAGFFANKTLNDFTSAIESPSAGIIYEGVNIIDLASTDVASAIAITNASGIIALVVDSESKTTSTGVCIEL